MVDGMKLETAVIDDMSVKRFWGYRKRQLTNIFMTIYDNVEELQEKLAADINTVPDNFKTYEVMVGGTVLYFQFCDSFCQVGTDSEKSIWS